MKRLMMIFAVTAAIFASCSKSEPESGKNDVNGNGRININLSVSEFGDGETKALIKTGWAEGDQLLIWFDENTGEKPDMVIKYNGSGWVNDGTADISGNTPDASGSMKVLYNSTLCVTAKDDYTFNSSTGTLSGRIQTWTFLTEIQVVVTGLTPAEYAKYSLSCSNFTPFTGYTVGTGSITATAGAADTPVSGISNTDGVAFVFASCTEYGSSAEYEFRLNDGSSSGASASTPTTPDCVEIKAKYDGTTETTLKWAKWNVGASKPEEYGYYFFWGGTQGYIYDTSKGYTLTKTLARKTDQIKGIKIAGSKFTARNCWANAKTGEELVDGFNWVNTPFNNGSSTYNDTYFSSVRGTVCPEDVLAKDYDAAYKYLGGNFRMPTTTELQAMRGATYWAWDATDKGYYVFYPDQGTKGSAGYSGTIAGTDDKTKALLFFPASGDGHDTSLSRAGSSGYYWSSSLNSSGLNGAYYLGFSRSNVNPQGRINRCGGLTVRPVSD